MRNIYTSFKIPFFCLLFGTSLIKSQVVVVPGYTISTIPVTHTVEQITVDHAGKRILLTGPNTTGMLDIFDITTLSTSTISSTWASSGINCWYPYSSTDIEYHNGYMYSCIPHNASLRDSVVKTNIATGASTILPTPTIPSGLTGIEGGAAFIGNKYYFTSPNASGAIFCLDFNTTAISTYSVNLPLVSYQTLEYNPVDDRLYASVGDALYRVNLTNSTIASLGNLNSATFSQFALDPNGLYAWTQNGSNIYKMSLATGLSTVIVNSLGGGIYQDLKFGPSTGTCNANGTSLYIGNNSNLLELKGFANTIAALSINTLTYCLGSTFKLPYLAIGNYCAGNVFSAELSNAAGSFASPVVVATNTTTSGADTLFCTIPSTLSAGTGYKIRVTSSAPTVIGYSSAMTLTIIASAIPTIAVNSGSICAGDSFTLSPSGGITYSYSGGSDIVSPATTTSYSVIGTNSVGCISLPAISDVTVNPTPTIMVNNGFICIGNSFTINPTGASTYTFSGGSANVSPTSTSSYSVTGTDLLGCISALAAISHVTVNSLPSILASTNTSLLCLEKTAILSASGANTYTWYPFGMGANILISPSVTTTYTVYGTDSNGCENMDTLTQFVSACAGIHEFSKTGNELFSYPNPFKDKFSLLFSNNFIFTNAKLIIYNSLGSIVYSSSLENSKPIVINETLSKLEIDLENNSSGIYFIKILKDDGHLNIKVIKE